MNSRRNGRPTVREGVLSIVKLASAATLGLGALASGVALAAAPASASRAGPLTAPGAPTAATASLVATANGPTAGVAVSWTAPASNGGSAILSYHVSASSGAQTCSVAFPTTTCNVVGLTDGTGYTFRVTATNAIGTGPASAASNSVVAATEPTAPTAVTGTPGNQRVVVSWTAPSSDGGSLETSSKVTATDITNSPHGGQTCSTSGTTTQCTVLGLTNGDTYTFTVVATNADGPSPSSVASGGIVPATAPSPPTGVTASDVVASGAALVSWTPGSSGGSAITSYTATSSSNFHTCSVSPPATSCTVSGQSIGSSYTYTVTATNAHGTSAASVPSASLLSTSVPAAPTAVTSATGNGQETVSFTGDTTTVTEGDLPIIHYTVTAAPGGGTCTTTSTSCTVGSLLNGTSYSFTVTATNSDGTGSGSVASPGLIAGVPFAPTGVRSAADASSQTTLDVSWTAATSPDGSPITGYTVTASPGGATCTTSGATTCNVTGLTAKTAYTFTVTATNTYGTGGPSAASSSVDAGYPGTPTAVTASLFATVNGPTATEHVSWTAPNNGGSAITTSTVTSSPGGLTCTASGVATTCNVSGLSDGVAYTFKVKAANTNGTGPTSAASGSLVAATEPTAPTAPTGTHGNHSAAIGWTAPSSNGGATVLHSTVTATDTTNSPNGGQTCTATGTATSCTVNGLTNGDTYTFAVTATNADGTSPSSASTAGVVPSTVPGPPTLVSAVNVPASGNATVSWTAPASTGGSAITSYTATASNGSSTCTVSAPTLTCTVSGLTLGTTYTYTVKAANLNGLGVASAASTGLKATSVPAAPTAVGATTGPGDATATVHFTGDTTLATQGGLAISHYTVTAADALNPLDGGQTCVTSGSSCAVTGLVDGQSYTFTATATNTDGTGPASTPSAPLNADQPYAPTGVVAAPDASTATTLDVHWTAAVSPDGSSPITGYTVTASPGGATCTTLGPTSCDVPGLTSGDPYSFTVVAANAAGTSVPSSASNSIVAGDPGPPTLVTASLPATANAATATVAVSWTAPVSGGSTLISYKVTSSVGDKTCTVSATSTTCNVTGLTDGAGYTFTVTATNGVGTGPASAASNTEVASTEPTAPTAVTGTHGNHSVLVRWTAPSSNGGALVSSSTVTATDSTNVLHGGQTCLTSGTATSCTVTGLTNGDTYTFAVTASNADGPSPTSLSSAGVVPSTLPSAPTGVTPTDVLANGDALVSFTPGNNGGAAITSYTVTSSSNYDTCTTAPPATSCTVSGRTIGDTYTYTATETNLNGISVASASSIGLKSTSVPEAPTAVTAATGNGQESVNFTGDTTTASEGGLAVDSYTVTAAPGGSTCSTSSTSCVVPSLTNGVAYTFTVTATNGDGTGAASVGSTPVTADQPNIPGGVSVAADASSQTTLDVSWSPDSSPDGTTPITGYTVTASPGGATCSTSGATSCNVSGLTAKSAYTFTVQAANTYGTSAPSAPSAPVDAGYPGTPTAVIASLPPTANAATSTVSVSWTAPNNGGTPLTTSTVTASPGGRTCTAATTATTCNVTGLTNGASYAFTVTASNVNGTGPVSAVSNTIAAATEPTAPSTVTGVSRNHSVTLRWVAPASNGGGAVTSSTATATDSTNILNGGQTCTASGTTDGCSVTGLTNGDTYTFTVAASNADGTGPSSAPSAGYVPSTLPDAPTLVTASDVVANGNALVSWTPGNDGGSAIESYTVSSSNGSRTCSAVPPATSCTVSGLAIGDPYTYTVKATNANGTSGASAPSASLNSTSVPAAPTAVAAVSADTQETVSFTGDTNTVDEGGLPITHYTVTATDVTNALDPSNGQTCTYATSPCVENGLTDGDQYTFTVTATNSDGTGPSSAPSAPQTPGVAPSAPFAVSASNIGLNGDAAVSWTAPSAPGGTIIAYAVTSSPGSKTCDTTGDPAATTCDVSGLNIGTSYTYTVTATNPSGTSDPSLPSNAAISSTTPDAPTGLTVRTGPGDGTVTVSFTGDTTTASEGGSAITDYAVTAIDATNVLNGGQVCTALATSCPVTGLTDGDTYTFTAVAINANGASIASVPSGSMNADQPNIAHGVVAAADAASPTTLDVSWAADTSPDGTTPISGYLVTSSPGGFTCSTAGATTCNVSGLTTGTTYTFTVAASNTYGTAPPSSASVGIKAGLPGPATAVTAVLPATANAATASVGVSWTAPVSGGSALTTYTVTSSSGAKTCTAPAPVTNCTVTGLTDGAGYTFTVVAKNANGSGPSSAASNSLVAATEPAVPTAVTGTHGNQTVLVRWTAPSSNGGSLVSSSTVTAVDSTNVLNGGQICTVSGTATSCTETDLTNGDTYTFTVTATNVDGTSPSSASSAGVVPSTLPSPPTAVTATDVLANGNALVSITPGNDGGAPATSYKVTSSSNFDTCTAVAPATSCTVSGRTLGDTYTYTATATNLNGTSGASVSSNSLTSTSVPAAPTAPSAVTGPGDGTVTVHFTGDTTFDSEGGLAISDYVVTATDSTNALHGGQTCTTSTTSCQVTGLTDGDSYTFTVTAVNTDGSSASSTATTAVSADQPFAPTGAVAAPDASSTSTLDVSWAAATSPDGTTPVSGYTVTSSPGSLTCSTGGATTCNVTGLTPGTAYTFTVTATNTYGTSAASTASAALHAGDPGAPTLVGASLPATPNAPTATVRVAWAVPVTGGSAFTSSTVTSAPGGLTCTAAGSANTCNVTGLTEGIGYTFTVKSTNGVGTGPVSAPSGNIVAATEPAVPTLVTGIHGNQSVTVHWTAPSSNGGSAVSGSTVTATDTTNVLNGGQTCPVTGAGTSCTVSGLTNGDTYTFTVTASNNDGTSAASAPSAGVVPSTLPSAPTSVSASDVVANGDALVSFTPGSNGGSIVTAYTVTSSAGNRTCTTAPPATSCTVTGLSLGATYTYTVKSTNLNGTSVSSPLSNSLQATSVPDAPTGVTATPGPIGTVTVHFTGDTTLTESGGLSITGYTATATDTTNVLNGGQTCTTTGSSCAVTGLTNGDAYTFSVTATNTDGTGPASAPVS